MKNKIKNTLLILLITCSAYSQNQPPAEDFKALYDKGDFKQALKAIEQNLEKIYSTRVEDKKIPTNFITERAKDKKRDLKALFRERTDKGFFIEENPEISNLHIYAGRINLKLKNYDASLSHFIQALRYKKIEPGKDSQIFYDMAQVFNESKHFEAYITYLEHAYGINPSEYSYSLELALNLKNTSQKQKALFHLEKYLENTSAEIKPELYLYAANLSEDIGKFLLTQKHYLSYLKLKPEDGKIHFALGYICLKKIGNLQLAAQSFDKSIKYIPVSDNYRISKSYEYRGDIALSDLEIKDAVKYYTETLKFHETALSETEKARIKLDELNISINKLKTALLKDPKFNDYEEYEINLNEKGKLEQILQEKISEYNKLNPGKVRWNLADSYERLENYSEAINYYNACIAFNYNVEDARDRSLKLKLKIKRGY